MASAHSPRYLIIRASEPVPVPGTNHSGCTHPFPAELRADSSSQPHVAPGPGTWQTWQDRHRAVDRGRRRRLWQTRHRGKARDEDLQDVRRRPSELLRRSEFSSSELGVSVGACTTISTFVLAPRKDEKHQARPAVEQRSDCPACSSVCAGLRTEIGTSNSSPMRQSAGSGGYGCGCGAQRTVASTAAAAPRPGPRTQEHAIASGGLGNLEERKEREASRRASERGARLPIRVSLSLCPQIAYDPLAFLGLSPGGCCGAWSLGLVGLARCTSSVGTERLRVPGCVNSRRRLIWEASAQGLEQGLGLGAKCGVRWSMEVQRGRTSTHSTAWERRTICGSRGCTLRRDDVHCTASHRDSAIPTPRRTTTNHKMLFATSWQALTRTRTDTIPVVVVQPEHLARPGAAPPAALKPRFLLLARQTRTATSPLELELELVLSRLQARGARCEAPRRVGMALRPPSRLREPRSDGLSGVRVSVAGQSAVDLLTAFGSPFWELSVERRAPGDPSAGNWEAAARPESRRWTCGGVVWYCTSCRSTEYGVGAGLFTCWDARAAAYTPRRRRAWDAKVGSEYCEQRDQYAELAQAGGGSLGHLATAGPSYAIVSGINYGEKPKRGGSEA
ncbi:hypothetical protein GY45DRAFT_1340482 [Cubamyces sp. BRFM 1775]|nr:hypothetical protein GY45DRAFT_1340482 [Cubamyces sp. BRFM 1775]